jgi:hypothetical protein
VNAAALQKDSYIMDLETQLQHAQDEITSLKGAVDVLQQRLGEG